MLVGVTRDPGQIDTHGYAVNFEVERVLSGRFTPGTQLRIGWEEMSPSRRPRFIDGGRVLLALEPLPGYSLWRSRFPGGKAHAVAQRGEGFLRDPDAPTLLRLSQYLSLPDDQRQRAAGAAALAALVAESHPDLAMGALQRLNLMSGLNEKLASGGMVWLVQGVHDPQRPMEIREGILALVAERMLHKLRGVVAELALPGGPLEAAATAALAALDGSLPVERVKLLLASRDPALRSVGVRYARDTAAEGRLRSLVRVDPDPEVRIAALDALVEWRGLRAFGDVEPALFDADPAVRARAALAIGGLGAETVPRLQELVERGSHEDAVGPIAALRFSGAEGTLALREIAAGHSDERVRSLAKIALGQGLGRH